MKPEDIAKKVREVAEESLKNAHLNASDDHPERSNEPRDRRPAKEADEHITLRKRRRPSGNDDE